MEAVLEFFRSAAGNPVPLLHSSLLCRVDGVLVLRVRVRGHGAELNLLGRGRLHDSVDVDPREVDRVRG